MKVTETTIEWEENIIWLKWTIAHIEDNIA